MPTVQGAVFLSYASEDAGAARRICEEAQQAMTIAERKWGDALGYQISYFYAGRKDADRAFL